jgi:LytTr DNA-binding domain
MTNGGLWGTSGQRVRIGRATYLGFGLFVLAATTVNALNTLHWAHVFWPHLAAWKPFVWAYTSGATSLVLVPLVPLLLTMAPPGRGKWARFALAHGLGTVVYCLIHVGGFILLRKLAYAVLGQHYQYGAPADLLDEYRKDLLGYFIALTFFALAAHLAANRTPAAALSSGLGAEAAIFDIREGARVIRARVSDIIAATAAGNYVEFHLADGRRPLMRTTLTRVAAVLASHGFVRTHRSWLVNTACVRVMKAERGSGDHRLELDGDVDAPLSRRFPEARDRLCRRP